MNANDRITAVLFGVCCCELLYIVYALCITKV